MEKIEPKKLKRYIRIATKTTTSLLALGFIILGTSMIVYYSRGYRLDRESGVVSKTGVLDISSDPFRADIFIDGEQIGKTPKTISSLKEGQYTLTITRDGYKDWEKIVSIVAEKSTPVYPHLFIENPLAEEVFKIDNELSEVFTTIDSSYIYILTSKELPTNPSNSEDDTPNPIPGNDENIAIPLSDDEDSEQILHKIWRYNTNPSFWGSSQNPKLVYEQVQSSTNTLELLPSPNGRYLLLKIIDKTQSESGTEIDTITSMQLLDSDQRVVNPADLSITSFVRDDYKYSWAEDSKHLLLYKNDQLVSYDVVNRRASIIEIGENSVWDSDSDSSFYLTREVDNSAANPEALNYLQIVKSDLNGTSEEILADKIYIKTDSKFLTPDTELLTRTSSYTFKNSPSNTQFVGNITEIDVDETLNRIFISTEFALYIYDLDTDTYTLVSSIPGPANLRLL